MLHKRLFLFVLFLVFGQVAQGQKQSLLSTVISIEKNSSSSVAQHLQRISDESQIIFTYSSSQINTDRVVYLPRRTWDLRELLDVFFSHEVVKYEVTAENRILISIDDSREFIISGFIKDQTTGEPIVGAYLIDSLSQRSAFSNESGFYSLRIPWGDRPIIIRHLGYVPFSSVISVKKDYSEDYHLVFDNSIAPVIIEDRVNLSRRKNPGFDLFGAEKNTVPPSIVGDKDVLQFVRNLSGVSPPNEGVGGFYVRGGNAEHNLILYDGVPMYEINHIGGFSSVFLDESVHSIDFYKGGFPAKYGGRLSSVMDVRLKDGRSDEIKLKAGLGLMGIEAGLEGPIGSKALTFNISTRVSWLHLYAGDLLSDLLDNDYTHLGFNDLSVKLSYSPDPTTKVSLTSYIGGDRFEYDKTLRSENAEEIFDIFESNELHWQNRLYSANLSRVLGSNLFAKVNLSYIKYKYQSRGTYILTSTDSAGTSTDDLDVVSYSEIEDYNLVSSLEYYHSDQWKFTAGINFNRHRFNPTIRQSNSVFELDQGEFFDGNTRILGNEAGVFSEATYKPSLSLELQAGMRLANFRVKNVDYTALEPRIKMTYSPVPEHAITFSYGQMRQNVHLLVNPGVGLPSDLWVPATDDISPQSSEQIDVSYSYIPSAKTTISVVAYYKNMDNILTYDAETDLFDNLVNREGLLTFTTSNSWESRVVSGTGKSRGVEVDLRQSFKSLILSAGYTFSKADRTFSGINNGESFPYKYDRRHMLNLFGTYNLNENWSLSGKWSYNTGAAFSLALEQFTSLNGVILLNSADRNNFRLPNYHFMDIALKYQSSEDQSFNLTFGLKNTYNRFNPFYVYLVSDPVTEEVQLKGVSIVPILPYVRASIRI